MIQSNYKRLYNVEKVYPNFSVLKIYKTPQYVVLCDKTKRGTKMDNQTYREDLLQQSLNRTKTTIRDIVLCNRFEHFCTFTFADHRDQVDVCKARMHMWLKNQQKLHGKFEYLIVPEFHKDGKSLHFHALFKGYTGKMKPAIAPKKQTLVYSHSGKIVLDLVGWRNGFSNATIIDQDDESLEKVANYVTKYITKEMPKFFGKKRYWVSQNLVRPAKFHNIDDKQYVEDENALVEDYETFTKITLK